MPKKTKKSMRLIMEELDARMRRLEIMNEKFDKELADLYSKSHTPCNKNKTQDDKLRPVVINIMSNR